MPKFIRNGVEYGGGDGGKATNAFLAQRAVMDGEGNNIPETYVTKSDYLAERNIHQISADANGHNSVFMGRDITKYFNDGSLYSRIASGKFEDIYVGDFFTCAIGEVNAKCRIAGLNHYMRSMNTFTTNHAVIVPDAPLYNAQMNPTHTTEGGYLGSAMRTTEIPKVNEQLQARFGDHLLTIKEYLTSTVDMTKDSPGYKAWKGVATAETLVDSKAELMSEVEVYGSRVWAGSGLDVRMGCSQFPLFALAPEFINAARWLFWLRGVSHSTRFASVHSYGDADYGYAGNSLGVRPRFLIG